MNAPTSPSSEPASEDALERSLRDYFRSKIPAPFPPLAIVERAPSPLPKRHGLLSRSRIVLAVCVSLLLFSLWFLLGQGSSGRMAPTRDLRDATGANKPLFPKNPTSIPATQPAK